MDNKYKRLMYYNLYKIECNFKNNSKPITFTEFDLLKLRDESIVKYYDEILCKLESDISDNDINCFVKNYTVNLLESTEIQIILMYFAINDNDSNDANRRNELYENNCYLALNWNEVQIEENRYVVSEGYQPLSTEIFQRAYGFYELSSGRVFVTNF